MYRFISQLRNAVHQWFPLGPAGHGAMIPTLIKAGILVGMLAVSHNVARARCPTTLIEYQVNSAGNEKFGYIGFLSINSNVHNYFLVTTGNCKIEYSVPGAGGTWTRTNTTQMTALGSAVYAWNETVTYSPPSCSATYDYVTGWSDGRSCYASYFMENMPEYLNLTNTYLLEETIDQRVSYCNDGINNYYDFYQETLGVPFTTELLVTGWQSQLQGMPWPTNDLWLSEGGAYRYLEGNELGITGARMRYRIHVFGEPCSEGDISWTMRFTPDNGPPIDSIQSNHVSFDSTGHLVLGPFIVEPPTQNGSISIVGGGGGSCSDGSCTLGEGQAGRGCGVTASFSLGSSSSGNNTYASSLSLGHATAPDADLSTPRALDAFGPYNFGTSLMEVLTNEAGIRQVKTPQGLADIQVTDPGVSYEIDFYSSWGAKDENGFYTLLGQDPVSRWTVTKTSDSPYTLAIQQDGGTPTLFTYQNGAWTSDQSGGLRQRTDTFAHNGQGIVITNTMTLQKAGGAVAYRETNERMLLSNSPTPVITRQIIGQSTASLTNHWFYYHTLATNDINYGKLRLKIDASGAWERYEYDGTSGRLAKTVRPFLNGATNALESDSRVTEYDYTPVHPLDTTGLAPDVARKVVEKLKGNILGLRYTVVLTNEYWTLECLSTNATWDNPNNLKTVYRSWSNPAQRTSGWQTFYPNGTVEVGTTETNTYDSTTTVDVGEPDSDPVNPSIIDGTRTETVSFEDGRVWTRSVQDISSTIYRVNEAYTYDDQKRVTRVDNYLDNTYTLNHYNCCTLEWSRDREGVYTTNTYDALKRPWTTVRAGITMSNVYNAPGQVLETWRFGTNASRAPIKTATYTFDQAGRRATSKDALNNQTSFSYSYPSGGGTLTTRTLPNSATLLDGQNRDGSVSQRAGTGLAEGVTFDYGIEAEGSINRRYVKEMRGSTNQWAKTYYDLLNRPYKTIYAISSGSNPSRETFYNSQGQKFKEIDPDGVITLFAYNGRGELRDTAIRVDQNDNSPNPDSAKDRITRGERAYAQKGAFQVERVTTSFPGQPITISERALNLNSANPTRSWFTDNANPTRTVSSAAYLSDGTRTVYSTNADGSYAVSAYQDGRLLSVNSFDASENPIGGTAYGYDQFGRQNLVSNAHNATVTTLIYNNNGQVVTNLVAAAGLPVQTNVFTYNNMGWVTSTLLPDRATESREYYASGLLKKVYGSRAYPVEYTYNANGQMLTMKTWKDYAGSTGAATNTWSYDVCRGWLLSKRDPNNLGTDYAYTAGGRLKTRTWARGNPRLVTTYTYGFEDGLANNDHGDVVQVSYSNDPASTPSVSYAYDQLGRLSTITRGGVTTGREYYGLGQILTKEEYSGEPSPNSSLNNTLGAGGRRESLELEFGGTTLLSQAYGYDPASRLTSVSFTEEWSGTYSASAAYSYVANSPLLTNIVFTDSSQNTIMTATRTHDNLNRLSALSYSPLALSHAYQYNQAGQRVRATLTDGSVWNYAYDSLGQVTSGKRAWSNGAPVAGEQFEYGFDTIGNRQVAGRGGDPAGGGMRYASYASDSANQLLQRTVPGVLEVIGRAATTATVTVNDQPTLRQAEHYWGRLPVTNSAGPLYTNLNILAVSAEAGVDFTNLQSGHWYVPQSPETYTHDADGNLTGDGHWTYTWDAENRLVAMETIAGAPTEAKRRLTFGYDYLGRRITKTVSTDQGGGWVEASSLLFVYDGWNLLAVFDANLQLLQTYVWGTDLSGTLQGAGGVGGLLFLNDYQYGTAGSYAYAYDGNGNVARIVGTDGTVAAEYEYGPFGELLRATGPMARLNPFRFSTKYQDEETDLLYYGFRYYNPTTGRWLSRDPLEEKGALNLFGFCQNDPVLIIDKDGREIGSICSVCGQYYVGTHVCPTPLETPTGFSVVGTDISREIVGAMLQAIGVDHVDITFNGRVVYNGNGGAAGRYGALYLTTNHTYPLSIRSQGVMQYGCMARCPCRGASEDDVLSCISHRPHTSGGNCQGDVQQAVNDCCLSGFGTIVGTFLGWL